MTTSALIKFLSIFSLASISMTVIDPALAKPVVHYGAKGTYTVDYEAGTYRGCLNSVEQRNLSIAKELVGKKARTNILSVKV
jgi:hypothetical protein